MLILGLESSCDETAAAVVENGTRVLSSVVASQTDLHQQYAGVVPELASRAHVERILPTVREALAQAGGGQAADRRGPHPRTPVLGDARCGMWDAGCRNRGGDCSRLRHPTSDIRH